MKRFEPYYLILTMPAALAFYVGCGKSTTATSSSVSASAPSTVISAISTGVSGAGTSLGKTAVSGNAVAMIEGKGFNPMDLIFTKAFASAGGGVDSVCDSHGSPLVSNSNGDYPGNTIYCKIAKNTGDPDSVQGTYTQIKSISCMLEKAGLVFDGVAHTVTATPDTTCFTAAQLTGMGTPASMVISVTASKPAAFNTYFDAGAVMVVPNFGTFSIGAKVSGSKFEFIAREDQTALQANKTGVYAANFDSSTGDLHFEARHDRFSCSEAGNCGWSRHTRIYAGLTVDSSGTPTGINRISGIHTSIGLYSGNYSAEVSTASGDLATGVKPRYFNYSGATSASMYNSATLTETTNTKCYTSSSSSGACTGNTGIGLPSGNVAFMMHPSTTYTSTAAWLAAYAGMTWTTVTVTDTQ